QLSRENMVKFTKSDPQYGTSIEVASVAMQAAIRLNKFNNRETKKIAVLGRGSAALWTTLPLRGTRPDTHFTLVRRTTSKLEAFSFVDEAILYQDMEKENEFDLVVEAVGGYGTETVMTNASKIVKPVGCILMLGVSEQKININTREWMEKGIMILTS